MIKSAAAPSALLLLICLSCCVAVERTKRRRSQQDSGDALVPRFVGEWESIPDLPLEGWLAEALGTQVGNDLIITGGFYNSFGKGLRSTLSLDLAVNGDPARDENNNYVWISKVRNPINFWTHAGHAVRGDHEMFLCGGYFKQNPGPEMTECYLFDKNDGRRGSYKPIPSLPQGRGGGGLVYIDRLDALLFSLGAVRPDGLKSTVDMNTTWIMYLDDEYRFVQNGTWIEKTPSPYLGNHVGAISAYGCGSDDARYFFLGGQKEEREIEDPIDFMYEYIPETDQFVQRKSMPVATGHITSAMVPYGCGFLLVGGATVSGRVDDIYYYDIENDDWVFVGRYPTNVTTAICGIYEDELTCSTGYTIGGYRRKLRFEATAEHGLVVEPTDSPVLVVDSVDGTPEMELSTRSPSYVPTHSPTYKPTLARTGVPTVFMTPTVSPARETPPSHYPIPVRTNDPTLMPLRRQRTFSPTALVSPTGPSVGPTPAASQSPNPEDFPTSKPTLMPLRQLTDVPTAVFTQTVGPTWESTDKPSAKSSPQPTFRTEHPSQSWGSANATPPTIINESQSSKPTETPTTTIPPSDEFIPARAATNEIDDADADADGSFSTRSFSRDVPVMISIFIAFLVIGC